MTIMDLIKRSTRPLPWVEGDNIPWNDPQFSKRMLQEHLSQDHDAASRRFKKIDKQVEWIHHRLLSGRTTRILDLGCGPGLYTSRLAKLGHTCFGIDYSPASIAYAAEQAHKGRLHCEYLHEDIRTAEYGSKFGLVVLIFGEFNIFPPKDARYILKKILAALANMGLILMEVHTLDAVRKKGKEDTSWYSVEQGLFSERPYIFLEESFWEPQGKTTTKRYYIVDAGTGNVERYAQSIQAYTKSQYISLLEECGFTHVKFFPSLIGTEDESQRDFMAIVARKEVSK